MAALSGEQLILMLKTIDDGQMASSFAIAALSQSVDALRNQMQTAERTWQVSHEELTHGFIEFSWRPLRLHNRGILVQPSGP